MTEGSGRGMMLAATLFFAVMGPKVYCQDSPLKIDIKTTQAVVKNGQDFEVRTKIENVSKEEQILHLSQCSYSALQWRADDPSVHVKQIFCKKNRLIEIRLKRGEAYERVLPVRIEILVPGLPHPVTFRLGFSLRDEVISVATPPIPPPASSAVPPIWSNAITVNIEE